MGLQPVSIWYQLLITTGRQLLQGAVIAALAIVYLVYTPYIVVRTEHLAFGTMRTAEWLVEAGVPPWVGIFWRPVDEAIFGRPDSGYRAGYDDPVDIT
ncbi:hypothetical protein [Stratiformator vulcanicus]|uniref:Uncharacterized protein n=1 Tax=Stratiformator vulcanicus TaxID=2527980 RepID=A0A517R4A3_9PLAN|nr:hypothetical protein [Stratiformator vulcanicus]QDT38653.1 hypothetical protein Pan189_30480 [Stratiformator vulcanicus]